METWSIVLAAGTASRFGGNKLLYDLGGKSVLAHSIAAAATVSSGIVAVLGPEIDPRLHIEPPDGIPLRYVMGGRDRASSVKGGLKQVPDSASIIIVHDAARPLASSALFARLRDAIVTGVECAVPVVDIVDTVRLKEGSAFDRNALFAVQTPQAFAAEVLRRSHPNNVSLSDDSSSMDSLGVHVECLPGERRNVKITYLEDIYIARALFEASGMT